MWKCGRLGMYQLKRRQCRLAGDTGDRLYAEMLIGCRFLRHLQGIIGPMPVNGWSDASYHPEYWSLPLDQREEPRLEWVRALQCWPAAAQKITGRAPCSRRQIHTTRTADLYVRGIGCARGGISRHRALMDRDITWYLDNEVLAPALSEVIVNRKMSLRSSQLQC